MANTPILDGLGSLAGRYDALICDVWGVIHNGVTAYGPAIHALRRFRESQGPVILLSNAPRPARDVEEQFARLRIPADCYDAIQTSGMAARADLERRLMEGPLAMLHLGPERDRGVFEGLDIALTDEAGASLVLCTGLSDDETETSEDYREQMERLAARGLPLLCANPDIVVHRGDALVYCAGALAQLYDALGGTVIYYGKPHRPVYDVALARAAEAAGRPVLRPLAVGDGPATDIAGANAAGIDALFIAGGIHADDLRDLSGHAVDLLFAQNSVHAIGALPALTW